MTTNKLENSNEGLRPSLPNVKDEPRRSKKPRGKQTDQRPAVGSGDWLGSFPIFPVTGFALSEYSDALGRKHTNVDIGTKVYDIPVSAKVLRDGLAAWLKFNKGRKVA